MSIKSLILLLVISVTLIGCSSDEKPADKKEKEENVIIGKQLKVMDKAKQLEATLKEQEAERRKKIDELTEAKESDDPG